MDKKEYKIRQRKLRSCLDLSKTEAFLVLKPVNIRYLTGFPGTDCMLLVTRAAIFFLTDFRYEEEARAELKTLHLVFREKHETLFESLRQVLVKSRIRRIFLESDGMSHANYVLLRRLLRSRKLVGVRGIVENLRLVKSPQEITLIRKSVHITETVLKKLISRVRPGVRELDLSAEAEYLLRRLGGECAAFPPIIVSGARTSQPHARPSMRRIARKGALLFDLGTSFKGYHSDLTRTFFLGRIIPKFEKFYYLVKESQDTAIARIKAGATIGEVDAACRSFLRRHRLARFFGHSLGHGVGLEVHEGPTIFYTNKKPFQENMVLTVEPGVYMPGWGGIRIEDMVRVTSSGCEVLTTGVKRVPQLPR